MCFSQIVAKVGRSGELTILLPSLEPQTFRNDEVAVVDYNQDTRLTWTGKDGRYSLAMLRSGAATSAPGSHGSGSRLPAPAAIIFRDAWRCASTLEIRVRRDVGVAVAASTIGSVLRQSSMPLRTRIWPYVPCNQVVSCGTNTGQLALPPDKSATAVAVSRAFADGAGFDCMLRKHGHSIRVLRVPRATARCLPPQFGPAELVFRGKRLGDSRRPTLRHVYGRNCDHRCSVRRRSICRTAYSAPTQRRSGSLSPVSQDSVCVATERAF